MKYTKLIFLFSATLILAAACRKDFITQPVIVPIPAGTVVSFDTVILPILTTNCAKSGCHVAGSQTPDLSAANAYNSLTNLGYVPVGDTSETDAKSCTLYQKLVATSNKMPPSGSLPGQDVANILAWIEQGSQNN